MTASLKVLTDLTVWRFAGHCPLSYYKCIIFLKEYRIQLARHIVITEQENKEAFFSHLSYPNHRFELPGISWRRGRCWLWWGSRSTSWRGHGSAPRWWTWGTYRWRLLLFPWTHGFCSAAYIKKEIIFFWILFNISNIFLKRLK